MKKTLSLKKMTIANLTNAELGQLHGGDTWSHMDRSDCGSEYSKLKLYEAGTMENSCESGYMVCM